MSNDAAVRAAMERALEPSRRRIVRAAGAARIGRLPEKSLHTRATDRHAAWARDHAAARDLDATLDALLDIEALYAELVVRTSPVARGR